MEVYCYLNSLQVMPCTPAGRQIFPGVRKLLQSINFPGVLGKENMYLNFYRGRSKIWRQMMTLEFLNYPWVYLFPLVCLLSYFAVHVPHLRKSFKLKIWYKMMKMIMQNGLISMLMILTCNINIYSVRLSIVASYWDIQRF